jgi:hypothetical protein
MRIVQWDLQTGSRKSQAKLKAKGSQEDSPKTGGDLTKLATVRLVLAF